MAAMAAGDMAAVVALLHPDVTFTGDSNRQAPTAARVILGPDKVARFMFGLARVTGRGCFKSNQLALHQRRTRRVYARGRPQTAAIRR